MFWLEILSATAKMKTHKNVLCSLQQKSYMVSRINVLFWKLTLSEFFTMVLLTAYLFLNETDTHCIEKNAFKIYINHLQKNSITLYSERKCQKYRLRFLFLLKCTFFLKTIVRYCLFTTWYKNIPFLMLFNLLNS